ncbi:SLC13 family permease [Gynuella sp.]|uniref:SLC13 family permease n=1 Tax=Gynuella sp. TaxID=2969146 RepID=UPI003D09626A
MNILIKLAIGLGIPFIIILIPPEAYPITGMTVVETRVIAIFMLAALFWVLEPIPIYATSLLVILLELITLSDKGFKPLVKSNTDNFGTLVSYKAIMATFASPIIILFLGGFFLAMAATKYRLDQNLARVLLKPFGSNPKFVMLGLMLITAVFSMFMSNTATTAMMLSILVPVLAVFENNDRGRIAFSLAIPFAANVGGIGTPIGTPPNAIALKYLTGEHAISFGAWMAFAVPYVVIMLFIAWILLIVFYPPAPRAFKLTIKGKFLKTPQALIVYITFAITILLWLTDFLHGMNSYVVAMIPVAVFSVTSIITKEDLKRISWDVLWLVSGGIALGLALEQSGLAQHVVHSIPFERFSPLIIIFMVSVVALLMANFMSHTATANLLLPLVAALGTSLAGLENFDSMKTLLLSVTFACSLGMSLPISTPPNALAFATGNCETRDMARMGVSIGIIGILMSFLMIYLLKMINFL